LNNAMEFSRHALNQMRRLRLSKWDVSRIQTDYESRDHDTDGRERYVARVRGTRIRVVIGVDNPDFVVTVHERRD